MNRRQQHQPPASPRLGGRGRRILSRGGSSRSNVVSSPTRSSPKKKTITLPASYQKVHSHHDQAAAQDEEEEMSVSERLFSVPDFFLEVEHVDGRPMDQDNNNNNSTSPPLSPSRNNNSRLLNYFRSNSNKQPMAARPAMLRRTASTASHQNRKWKQQQQQQQQQQQNQNQSKQQPSWMYHHHHSSSMPTMDTKFLLDELHNNNIETDTDDDQITASTETMGSQQGLLSAPPSSPASSEAQRQPLVKASSLLLMPSGSFLDDTKEKNDKEKKELKKQKRRNSTRTGRRNSNNNDKEGSNNKKRTPSNKSSRKPRRRSRSIPPELDQSQHHETNQDEATTKTKRNSKNKNSQAEEAPPMKRQSSTKSPRGRRRKSLGAARVAASASRNAKAEKEKESTSTLAEVPPQSPRQSPRQRASKAAAPPQSPRRSISLYDVPPGPPMESPSLLSTPRTSNNNNKQRHPLIKPTLSSSSSPMSSSQQQQRRTYANDEESPFRVSLNSQIPMIWHDTTQKSLAKQGQTQPVIVSPRPASRNSSSSSNDSNNNEAPSSSPPARSGSFSGQSLVSLSEATFSEPDFIMEQLRQMEEKIVYNNEDDQKMPASSVDGGSIKSKTSNYSTLAVKDGNNNVQQPPQSLPSAPKDNEDTASTTSDVDTAIQLLLDISTTTHTDAAISNENPEEPNLAPSLLQTRPLRRASDRATTSASSSLIHAETTGADSSSNNKEEPSKSKTLKRRASDRAIRSKDSAVEASPSGREKKTMARRRASDRGTRTRASLLSSPTKQPFKKKLPGIESDASSTKDHHGDHKTINTDDAVASLQQESETSSSSARALESSTSGRETTITETSASSLKRSDQQSVVPSLSPLAGRDEEEQEENAPIQRSAGRRNSLSITRRHDLGSEEMSISDLQASDDDESFVEETAVEVDYYRNPTLLGRLIQFQKYESALLRLEENPKEASTWLVAKQQHQPRRRSKRAGGESGENTEPSPTVLTTLRQLPLHMACQSFSLLQSHDPNHLIHVLEELLKQLLVVYPRACQEPDHNGMYPIHYMIQYRAPPELISLALITFPKSASSLTIRDPLGRSLQELFQSTAATAPSDLDRPQRRQEEQIEELLEFDTAFWVQARKESRHLKDMQNSWVAETEKTHKSKESSEMIDEDLLPPWQLAKERERLSVIHQPAPSEETERTFDESQSSEGEDLLGDLDLDIVSEKSSEGISPAAWSFLEQRALTLEQLVMESNSRNYELQQCLNVLAEERDTNATNADNLPETGQTMTELARQAYELRKENEKLKSELRVCQVRLGRERESSLRNVFRRGSTSSRVSALAKAVESSLMSSATTLNSEAVLSAASDSKGDVTGQKKAGELGETLLGETRPETEENTLPPQQPSSTRRRSSGKVDIPSDASRRSTKLRKKEKSRRRLNAKSKKKSERSLKKEASRTEIQQREVNRKIHQEYHALVQRHREQEQTLKRLEKTVDALLENSSGVDPNTKGAKKAASFRRKSKVDLDDERREALSWLPSWMRLPETDNLSSIFQHACDQEDNLRKQEKIDIHRRLQSVKPKATLPNLDKQKSTDPSAFHYDIELSFLATPTDPESGQSSDEDFEMLLEGGSSQTTDNVSAAMDVASVSCRDKPRASLMPVTEILVASDQDDGIP